MRVHTGKGVLLGSEGGEKGILLFLGRARRESRLLDRIDSDSSRRRRHNLGKGFSTNKGEVLLPGELWRSGDREILINWEKKKKKRFQN